MFLSSDNKKLFNGVLFANRRTNKVIESSFKSMVLMFYLLLVRQLC